MIGPGSDFEAYIFHKLHILGNTKIIVRNCYGGGSGGATLAARLKGYFNGSRDIRE